MAQAALRFDDPAPAKTETGQDNQQDKASVKGRPRSEKSRQSILKATNSLLLHKSVQELSIEAIAKKAGVGKTTIYRWWPNKTAVVMEALVSQPGMQESEEPNAKSNAEALEFQLAKLIRLLQSKNGETIAQLFSEAQASQESLKIFENNFLGPLIDAIGFSIEQGQKDGEFRTIDTKSAVDMLCGPIFFRLMAHPADFNEKFQETWPQEATRLIAA